MSADTIVPGYANPQNLNRYSYVNNNPLYYTDPTGHWADEGCGTGGPGGGTGCNLPITSSGNGGGNGGGGGGGYTPSVVIPDLPCGGMLTCGQQTAYEYAASLLPFTSSDACYFLLYDPILCNSSSWQNLPNSIVYYANLPSWTQVYTTTYVTNSLGDEISPPAYVAFGGTVNFPVPPYMPQIFTGPDPDHLDPGIPTGVNIVIPSTVMQTPPLYEILVNTTTTTTTVVYDHNGNVMGTHVDVTYGSEPMTPYWQNQGDSYTYPYMYP